MFQGKIKDRAIEPRQKPQYAVFSMAFLFFTFFNEIERKHRHEKQGQQEARRQREKDRPRHWTKHLPFDAGKGQDRNVHDHYDEDAVDDRFPHLGGGVLDQQKAFSGVKGFVFQFLQATYYILYHHHRSVHDEAEIEGPQAHEARRYAESDHTGKSREHGKGYRQGDQNRRLEVSQDQKKHNNNKEAALQEVLYDRTDGGIDQIAPGVELYQPYVTGKTEFSHRLLNGKGHLPAVRPHPHEHRAEDRFIAVIGGRPQALLAPLPDFRYIPDAHRGAEDIEFYRDISNFFKRIYLPLCPDDDLVSLFLYIAAAKIDAQAFDTGNQVPAHDAVIIHPGRVNIDMYLLLVPSVGFDFGDTGDGLQ